VQPLLLLLVVVYIAQIYFLDRIERYDPVTRKRIWITSLAIHAPILVLVAVGAIIWSKAVVIAFAPELISAALHVRGIQLHAREARVA